jgi:DNA repair protein RecN (Recombination protein N)
MLSRLSIRDFAVVARAELAFGPGLTVISGETGAGKSLLVDALGFLCGARADAGAVRHGAERAELAAEFELADQPSASAWLRQMELDDAGACLVRRTLRADGGSRAWINGRAATLAQLAELTALLVQVHGQHEQQALLSRANQTALLDGYARHPGLLAATRETATRWRALDEERRALLARGDVGERTAWLRHQLDELAAEELEPAALAQLDASHRRQAHAASLIVACEQAVQGLGGDDASLAAQLARLRAGLQRESAHEPRLAEVDGMLDAAAIQLDESLALLERIRDDLDLDPDALAALERRVVRVQDLARKHRVPLDGLAAHHDALAGELAALAGAGERLGQLDGELARLHDAWRSAAAALGASRRDAGARLATQVADLIDGLGMQGGEFAVALEPHAAAAPDPLGAERAELLVSANPGQPLRPLRKVASGGELSRLSLAIEVATLGQDAVPTLVFDEVDAGIGGAVAASVGARLRALGEARQVLCVTHQPQVAAAGHAQYRVSKASQAGITQSHVAALDAAGRVAEIARMLGGARVTPEAEAAARRLLDA